jgi:hypothetical protein
MFVVYMATTLKLFLFAKLYTFSNKKKPNIQVEKSEISLKTKHCPETPNILDRRKGTSTIWRKKFTSK